MGSRRRKIPLVSIDASDPYVALAAELARVGRRLDAMSAELMRLRAAASTPGPSAAVRAGAPQTIGVGGAHVVPPAAAAGVGGVPGSEGFPGAPAAGPQEADAGWAAAQWRPGGAPQAPAGLGGGPRAPWQQPGHGGHSGPGTWPGASRRARPALSGARVLAWTGAGVTLLGVVLLLVLVTSRGWFAPPARVAAGALLGVALIGLALRLHRRPDGRMGALAPAAAGFATLYLVVAAATTLYGYLPPVPALLVALVVAAAGLGLADRWRAQPLAVGVVAGAALLAPVLAGRWLLVALVLALQLAALPVVLRRRWPVLVLVAAAGPILYGAAVASWTAAAERAPTVAVASGVLVVGLATALPAARVLPVPAVAVLVAGSPLPVLAASVAWGGWGGAGVAAAAVTALSAFAAVPGTDRVVRIVAVAAAAVALFQATLVALDGSTATLVLLGQAVVATVLAAQLRARLPLAIGAAYGTVAVLAALGRDAPVEGLVRHPALAYSGPGIAPLVVGAAVSALVLVLAVVGLVAAGRVGLVRGDGASAALWVPVGLVGLYGAASLVVTLALLVSDDRAGFTAGHALVTVSWTVAALVLLARGISRAPLRVAGMVLVGAAVTKLVLFDLVALDGLSRVVAFLGAGLVLLAAGTRYARVVAGAARPADEQD